MNKITTPLYRGLISWLDRTWAHRQLAYFCAGWLSLVGLRPALPPSRKARLQDILLGAALLPLLLLFFAQFLTVAQPALHSAGGLTGGLTIEKAILGVVVIVNVWRYLKGRALMLDLQKASAA